MPLKKYEIYYEYELAGWDEGKKTHSDIFKCSAPSLSHALKQLGNNNPLRRIVYYESTATSIEN